MWLTRVFCLQEAMHLQEEERKIYINLSNQEKLAEQEQARADKVCIPQHAHEG